MSGSTQLFSRKGKSDVQQGDESGDMISGVCKANPVCDVVLRVVKPFQDWPLPMDAQVYPLVKKLVTPLGTVASVHRRYVLRIPRPVQSYR